MSNLETGNNNTELTKEQEASKNAFETDFPKKEKDPNFHTEEMNAIKENYNKGSAGETFLNAAKSIAGNLEKRGLSENEITAFNTLIEKRAKELNGLNLNDEKGKEQAILEIAENVKEINKFIKGIGGGKGKISKETGEAVDKSHEKERKKAQEFSESLKKLMNQINERQNKEQEASKKKRKTISQTGDNEQKVASAEGERKLKDWPYDSETIMSA
ncbi:MAG: hypothetical protein N4A38_04465 [Candidatus Gracilibacteria bacterium]|nr:hypothetical protein [Candidatus Gracilibacteria bacterium]